MAESLGGFGGRLLRPLPFDVQLEASARADFADFMVENVLVLGTFIVQGAPWATCERVLTSACPYQRCSTVSEKQSTLERAVKRAVKACCE